MAWIVLLGAGLLEIVWSLALKRAGGLRRPGWLVFGIAVAMVSLGMLALALRELPVGGAYAVWVGVGAVGVAGAGMLFLGESASPGRLLSLAAIVVGVAGLHLVGG
ncbi:SMR family transporter [Nocardiopsis exhalans]|uniref:SMR family transporter n=1 Tax=Nocardiopsis exhalans TaxID=163604 RepID=A0ABY5DHF9_9ACTN|nr:SMR family transporter [Nocardiopsis exhalans]USY22628.1 SMR family transporter [Nocardiopsis exhalans]